MIVGNCKRLDTRIHCTVSREFLAKSDKNEKNLVATSYEKWPMRNGDVSPQDAKTLRRKRRAVISLQIFKGL